MSVARVPDGSGGFVDIDEQGNETPVPPKVDAGPSARRAMAGGRPGAAVPTDDELGISSPLATPAGRTMPTATGGGSQPVADLRPPPEPGLVHEDPIGTVVAGGYAAKAGGAAARAIPGVLGTLAEGATAAAVPTAVAGGSAKEVALAAGLGGAVGGVLGGIGRAKTAIGNAAQARVDARLPTAITGGAKTKAARSVIGLAGNGLDDEGGRLLETVNAHPELKDVLSKSGKPAERAAAVTATKAKLNALTAGDFGQVDAQKGGFEADEVIANLRKVAKASTSPATEDAANNIADDLARRYGSNGKIPAQKLRDYRNELGEFAFKTPPASPAALPSREAALRAAHGAINDAIEDTMAGLSVPEPKLRTIGKEEIQRASGNLDRELEDAESRGRHLGIRIEHNAYSPGDILPPSAEMSDGDLTGETLDGTSVISPSSYLRNTDREYGGYRGKRIYLTEGDHATGGTDPHEIILRNARVIRELGAPTGVDVPAFKVRNRQVSTLIPVEQALREQAAKEAGAAPGGLASIVHAAVHPQDTAVKLAIKAPSVIDTHLAKLAGTSGPSGVAALKAVALQPSSATLRAAVQAGVAPQVALQVARLGAQPAGAQ